jgi:hypothetical protein
MLGRSSNRVACLLWTVPQAATAVAAAAAAPAAGEAAAAVAEATAAAQAAAPGAAANVITDTDCLMRSALATWQEVHGQVQRVPASHQQLLGLFGVSPQAAVWVAALMGKPSHGVAPTFGQCQIWNPHLLKVGQAPSPEKQLQLQALAAALQPQLQCWSDTPLLALLQSVLLYGAAYATPGQDPNYWTMECILVNIALIELQREQRSTAADADSISGTDDVTEVPLPDTVRDEMLLLFLNLLPRVQQLRGSGADAGSRSSSRSMAASATAAAGPGMEESVEGYWTQQLLAAAQAVCVPSLAAGAALAEEQAAGLPAVWQQQAAAIYRALEVFFRAHSSSETGVGAYEMVRQMAADTVCLCAWSTRTQPGLLLALARGGSSEQQVAFFHLLLSLLKLPNAGCAVPVATSAVSLLGAASYADAISSSDGCVSLWLLLLGRCCLLWAADLRYVQGQGSDWVRLLQQAQQGRADVADCAELVKMVAWCFTGPLVSLVDCVLSYISEGSSLCAGLSAAGYDLGPIVQGFGGLVTCCTEIGQWHGMLLRCLRGLTG